MVQIVVHIYVANESSQKPIRESTLPTLMIAVVLFLNEPLILPQFVETV